MLIGGKIVCPWVTRLLDILGGPSSHLQISRAVACGEIWMDEIGCWGGLWQNWGTCWDLLGTVFTE